MTKKTWFALFGLVAAAICGTAHAQWKAESGLVLVGKVVTMNDAGVVLPNARIWLANGKIMAIAKADETLPAAAKDPLVIETKGVIYPGMIDLHNHPDYGIYPLMPIKKKYADRYEWRWYDEVYNKRITYPQELMTRADYFDLGLEIGRYGEYKALAGGTTSIQGGGALNRGLAPGKYGKFQELPGGSPPLFGTSVSMVHAREECLVRNVEFSKVEARVATSRVDIGNSARSWAEMQAEKARGPLVVHLAEGASSRMAGEFNSIKDSALLGPELIAIHGVGLTEPQLIEMAKVGAKLVWSPLSNFMLYGKTANVAAAKRAGLSISLAPDWAPSGSKSVLGELKVADLVNKNALKGLFTDRELVEMVTRKPADALDWGKRLGQITEGYLADVIIVDDKNADPYRNLIVAIEENIQLVVVRGEPLYGDAAIMQATRGALNDIETTSTFRSRDKSQRVKAMAPNCASTGLPVLTVAEIRGRLQEALKFDAAYALKKISSEQITNDLQRCEATSTTIKTGDPVTTADARRMLKCRFGLPLEKTSLSALTTNEDPQFFSRLMKNPNLPKYLQALPGYYR
ncbi:MAG: amidohydrolase family protein, partial [Burkholderiales bacterium]|nr:amidohydrolase family protein [Burkholderiales bacterium]